MVSTTNDILDDLITKLSNISTANGYNYTPTYIGKVVKDVYEISEFPQISIMIGDGDIQSHNSSADIFKETMDIYIVGYVNASTDISSLGNLTTNAENLITDIKRAILNFPTTNINEPNPNTTYLGMKYLIDVFTKPISVFRALDDRQNVGMIGVSFKIISYAEDFESLNADYWSRWTPSFESQSSAWEL